MCGISSIYRYTRVSDDDVRRLTLMNEAMRYRGPDDSDVWHNERCAMAQVRLSIIGLSKGHQPLFNEDESLVLICNGEIYNYKELRADLEGNGHCFSSDSDCETILHLYEEYGTRCVEHLRGMFAFVLYDIKGEQMFAARDRIGEKTLYYAEVPCGVVCSTELKTILEYYIPQPQVDVERLLEPMRFTGPIDMQNTWVSQIKRLMPGEFLCVSHNGVQRAFYWKRSHAPLFEGSYDEAKKQTLALLQESVELCLRSDVPVAVMLSGGIDSSAVAALARMSGREVHTITAGYDGNFACDERAAARRFAKEQGFDYHEVVMNKSDYHDAFDELSQYIDEPITDSAAIAQWALYKKVKSLGFKVLLGGMGGDELFYGYPAWNRLAESLKIRREHESIFPWNSLEKKKHYIRFIIRHLKHVLFAGYPQKLEDRSFGWWIHDDYYKCVEGATLAIGGKEYHLADYCIHKQFKPCAMGSEIDVIYDDAFDKIMVGAYLYLSDRLGMGNSLEIRSPFLDYRLVEHVMALPLHIKYNAKYPKQYLKDVLTGIVPDYILYAEKRGFTPPNEYVADVANNHQYQFIKTDYSFYNSALADKLLQQLWKS